MIYVCPHFDSMPTGMQAFSRLYAYPCKPAAPPDDGFVILDSGAFALSRRGGCIGKKYMLKLIEHYRRYITNERIFAIAPDVYLDPYRTMQNWKWWYQNCDVAVVPVIQFRHQKRLDLYLALEQAQFYVSFEPKFVCISNPGMLAVESQSIVMICQTVRNITGAQWLHNLGAGWSPQDVRDWYELGCFDSIDSIAYYTDAQAGRVWRRDGGSERSKLPWRELAVHNAAAAAAIARGE